MAIAGPGLDGFTPPPPPQPPAAIPQIQPIVSIDDQQTQGPSAKNWLNATFEVSSLAGDGPVFDGAHYISQGVWSYAAQLSVAEPPPSGLVGAALGGTASYEGHVRFTSFSDRDDSKSFVGPMTFVFQHYIPIQHVTLAPLADAHLGVEFAASTPWLSGRNIAIPTTVREVDSTATELARDGWSVRPVTGYLRGDFLVCRSVHVEIGAGPEVFSPAQGTNEYDLRTYVAAGASLGCSNAATDYLPKLEVEYRQRHRLYADNTGYALFQNLGVALQEDVGPFIFELFAAADPSAQQYRQLGIRVQVGAGRR
jgi:hypothetical protein|nr:hypothetical protein [Kofleriaceae bacterium]